MRLAPVHRLGGQLLRVRQIRARLGLDHRAAGGDEIFRGLDLRLGGGQLLVQQGQLTLLRGRGFAHRVELDVQPAVRVHELGIRAQRVALRLGADLLQHGGGFRDGLVEGVPVSLGALLHAAALELFRFLDFPGDLFDQRLQALLRGDDVLVGVLHAHQQGVGQVQGPLGFPDDVDQPALLAGGLVFQLAAPLQLLLRLREGDFGHLHVVVDGFQHRLVVARAQIRQGGPRRLHASAQGDGLLRELVEFRAGVDQQVAQLVELGGLLVQRLLGQPAGGDDVDQHRALLRLGLRDGVVELLLRLVRALQGAAGVVHRPGERAGALRAELGDGDVELLAGVAHRLVRGDDGFLGAGLQRFHRQAQHRVRVVGGELPGGLQLLGGGLFLVAARDRPDAGAGADHGHPARAQPGGGLPGDLARGGRTLDGGQAGARPIGLHERAIHGGVDVVEFLVGPVPGAGVGADAVLAVLGGDRRDQSVHAAVGRRGLLRPLLRGVLAERRQIDDEDRLLVVPHELVDRVFDLGDFAGAQDPGGVGDAPGQLPGRNCARRGLGLHLLPLQRLRLSEGRGGRLLGHGQRCQGHQCGGAQGGCATEEKGAETR